MNVPRAPSTAVPHAHAAATWHAYPDGATLAGALAATVAQELQGAIDRRGVALLAVSGGRTPQRFFHALSTRPIDWRAVLVTLVDERCVHVSHERSNERLVREHLLRARAAAASLVGLYDHAARGDATSAAARRIAALPLPLDAIVLGMGTDGHTASWFPDAAELDAALALDTGARVVSVSAPSVPDERLTLTLPVVAASPHVHLHIEGAAKRAVAERAEDASRGATAPPARALPVAAILRAAPVAIHWSP